MYSIGMNKLDQRLKELIGHDIPYTNDEIHGVVEDQYVKAKYGNENAREFVGMLQALKQQQKRKPKRQYICLQCKQIVNVKMRHIRESHKDMLWFDGKLHSNIMQYMFMGVD